MTSIRTNLLCRCSIGLGAFLAGLAFGAGPVQGKAAMFEPASGPEASAAALEPLVLGRLLRGSLGAGEHKQMVFEADAGDLVHGTLQSQLASGFQAKLVGPSGETIRDLKGGYIAFVAPAKGRYELLASNASKLAGTFTLILDVAKPIDADTSALGSLESPRMKEIGGTLAKGQTDTNAFWSQISANGTPLIERVGEDYLVTFLWRGTPATRTVKVQWPFFHIAPLVELKRLAKSDIWFRTFRFAPGTRFTYSILPDPPLVEGPAMLQALSLIAVAQPDPLNKASRAPAGNAPPGSLVELPPTITPSKWNAVRPEMSKGEVSSFQFDSKILKNSRRISVYTPPGYRPDCGPYGLLMLFDGSAYQSMIPVPTILDNLIAAKRIAPMIAVFIDNASIESRSGEMYPNQPFTDFVSEELLGRIRSKYAVTRDPKNAVLGGFSLGGLAAAHVAWRRPDIFGGVLSQSGAFWWSSEAIKAGRGEPILAEGPMLDPRIRSFELASLFAKAPKAPIRLYLEAGLYEGDLLTSNRFLKDVLTAKEYPLTYREFPGGHDGTFWRESFADGLLSLVGNRPAAPQRCGPGQAAGARSPSKSTASTVWLDGSPSRTRLEPLSR